MYGERYRFQGKASRTTQMLKKTEDRSTKQVPKSTNKGTENFNDSIREIAKKDS